MCTFAHVIRDFVVKTKITIWAESICGFSPFFFSFQKFYRTVIIRNCQNNEMLPGVGSGCFVFFLVLDGRLLITSGELSFTRY